MTNTRPLNFFSAAVEVLRTVGRPLTTRVITAEALSRGLIVTQGKTPQKSMEACLYTAIRDDPECPIERLFEAGRTRARNGSVRWTLGK
ncbi:MAG: hypothetical protein CL878_09530 [Dehalococcoidia bacterium]|nr:hypothetical protein [Dehalococcoidia bacterium]